MIESVITEWIGCYVVQEAFNVQKVIGTSAQGYGKTMRTRRLMRKRDRLRNFEEEE